jgi:SNF2 family DNA or RNA helicase
VAAAAVSNSKQFFDKKNRNQKSGSNRTLIECAFQLLQWAQNGTPLEDLIELTSTTNTSDSEEEDGLDTPIEEDVDMTDPTTQTDEEQAVPEWAQAIVETGETSGTIKSSQEKWMEMETPDGMKVELRPYQKQALYWMVEREQSPDLNLRTDDNRSERMKTWKVEQIQLLKELAQSSDAPAEGQIQSDVYQQRSPKQNEHPIACECGPVRIDTDRVEAPSVVDMIEGTASSRSYSSPSLAHPLWERRYLTNASLTNAYSFFVQPFLGKAMASPPPPPVPCRGGIIADEMGLGKTVMILALLQSSKNKDRHEAEEISSHNNSTLIVTPLSLLAQWQEEIETKTSLSCMGYYGDAKKNATAFSNHSADVVLTTYGTLQAEFCREKQNRGMQSQSSWLFSQRWKHCILDEAHQIKNHSTVVSRACCQVNAERRWCVSGTIIQNSLDDVYALMRFLRHEPWCEYGFWKAAISTLPDLSVALDRIKRLLGPIMIRRTKDSLGSDGKPILTLPDIDYESVKVEFTSAERQFYEALYRKSFDIFHGFMKAGIASSSWLKIFSLLHRLRQTCSHVALTVKSHIDDDEWTSQIVRQEQNSPDADAGNTSKRNIDGETRINDSSEESIEHSFLDDLHSHFKAMQDGMAGERGESDADDSAYALNIASMLNDAIQREDSHLKDECSICLENLSIHNSVVTPCLHLFCRKCLEGMSPGESVATCPVCQEQFNQRKILCLSQTSGGKFETRFLHDEMKGAPSTASIDRFLTASPRRGVGDARKTLHTALQGSASSKLCKIREELDSIWRIEPGSKVLIFSQFLGFLDILEQALTGAGIQTWRLDGKLSLKERMAVLKEFGSNSATAKRGDDDTLQDRSRSPKRGSVLLISIKLGAGLNLVSARSVFIVGKSRVMQSIQPVNQLYKIYCLVW